MVFSKKIEENLEVDNGLLHLFLKEYITNKYIALESFINTLIRNERLTDQQIEIVIQVIDCEAPFQKELAGYHMKRKIRNGGIVDAIETSELINLNALEALEIALKVGAISIEGMRLFEFPKKGVRNRNSKLKLFQMAQDQLDTLAIVLLSNHHNATNLRVVVLLIAAAASEKISTSAE